MCYTLGITKAVNKTKKGTHKMRTATYVSDAPLQTDSIVWQLSEPLGGFDFLVTSIVTNEHFKETAVFGYADGEVDYNDLGIFQDSPIHAEAIARVGYQVNWNWEA